MEPTGDERIGKLPLDHWLRLGPAKTDPFFSNERFKDRNDEWQERTEWHSIVAWRRLAEIGELPARMRN